MSRPDDDPQFDIVIIGAGIAGAALACFAAPHARVALLEREAMPGLHSTGRSAAMFEESYGPESARALTRASRAFLEVPQADGRPFITPRGALYIATQQRTEALHALHAALRAEGAPSHLLDRAAAQARVPVLRPEAVALAVLDEAVCDIDVDRLHQRFLRGAAGHGARLFTHADVQAIERDGADWRVVASSRHWRAPLLVNAAGAWADAVGALAGAAPLGLAPRRRSAFTFAPPAGLDCSAWPCVADVDETFYFKPEAGVLLGSPANADPVPPHDVVPEELDIATGIFHIEAATTLTIRRPLRSWAGLRSFVPDGALVGGFDPVLAGFFWCCGQGGYGIQTSPAMGEACAARLLGFELPERLAAHGISFEGLAPRP